MAEERIVNICEGWECWANSDPNTFWEVDVRFSHLSYRFDVVLNVKTGKLVEDSDVVRLRSELSDLDDRLPEITRRLIAIDKWWNVPASDSKPSEKYEKVSAQISAEFPRREELLTAWGLMQNDICVGLEVTVRGVSHVNAILSHMTRDRGFFTSMLVERSSSRDGLYGTEQRALLAAGLPEESLVRVLGETGDVYKIVFIW